MTGPQHVRHYAPLRVSLRRLTLPVLTSAGGDVLRVEYGNRLPGRGSARTSKLVRQ